MHDLGGIFEDDENGRGTSDLSEVMNFMSEAIQADKLTVPDAVEALLNLVKPGRTDDSHDILREFRTAMAVQGYLEVADQVQGLWLTIFPWGLGFHMGFEPEYPVAAISHDGKAAIIKSLCAILQQGHVNASVNEKGRINIVSDEGDEQTIDIDQVVKEFRKELDVELGPDPKPNKPEPNVEDESITDWIKKWMS